jgi:hypothetical protein
MKLNIFVLWVISSLSLSFLLKGSPL